MHWTDIHFAIISSDGIDLDQEVSEIIDKIVKSIWRRKPGCIVSKSDVLFLECYGVKEVEA